MDYNLENFTKSFDRLKTKYSVQLVGEMLGYLTPWQTKTKTKTKSDPEGFIYWEVGKIRIFSESISEWSNETRTAAKAKFELLKSCMPNDLTLVAQVGTRMVDVWK